jgi:hypothetical protein
MFGLNRVATVYTPHATTGDFTVLARSALVCRLAIKAPAADADQARAQLAGRRTLLWQDAYTMPDNAQLLIGSDRWNVEPGTVEEMTGLSDAVVYRRCQVVKVT